VVDPDPDPPVEEDEKFAVTGGCNTTSTGSFGHLALGFLLMSLGAFLFIRRRRILGTLIVICGLAVATAGNANAFPTQNFKPAPGTADYWQTEDAKLSLPSVKLLWHYENDPLALENLDTGARKDLINHRHTLHLLGAYTLYQRVQVGADLPLVLGQWNGDLGALGASDAAGGIANIRLLVKVLVAKWDHIAVGLGVDVGLPTSTVEYVDDAGFTVTPKAMVSGYIGPVSLAVNAGLRVRDPDTYTPGSTTDVETIFVESEFVGSAGAKWKIWNNDTVGFTLVSDLFLHVPLKGAKDRTMPVELINGLKVGLPAGFELSAGAGVGLTSGVGAPDFRLLGGLTWAYEPAPCVLQPVYKVEVVKGPPLVEEIPVPVPVPIINPVYFPFDEHYLTTEAQATLLDDLEAIDWAVERGLQLQFIVLVGRADRRGTNDYNQKLAEKRAQSVKDFLVKNDVVADSIKIVSEGEEKSDQETTDELQLQRDRTVIIKLETE
jgi:MYXO-CTERM domain-containing protein